MTKIQTIHRLGATAIAAVLAVSANPALAQVAEPAATTPIDIGAPTVPVADAPSAAPEALSPETPTPTEDAPVISAEPATAKPAPRASATRVSAPARQAAATRNEAATSSAKAPSVAPQAQPPVTPVTPQPAAAPAPAAPLAGEPAPVAAGSDMNADLPLIAGGAGAALLALLGTGLVLGRRRRRNADDDAMSTNPAEQPVSDPTPAPMAERSAFAWGNPPQPSTAPTQPLPVGFNTSRYGRHVQAAYRGPTPDNPSLSLKKRIKRAAFFDLRERQAAAARSGGGRGMTPSLIPA